MPNAHEKTVPEKRHSAFYDLAPDVTQHLSATTICLAFARTCQDSRAGGGQGRLDLFKWKWQASRRAQVPGDPSITMTLLENKVCLTRHPPNPVS